jgi:hypothetical protein
MIFSANKILIYTYKLIRKWRIVVLAFLFTLALALFFFIKPEFSSLNESFWLDGSNDHEKLLTQNMSEEYIYKLSFQADAIDNNFLESLKKIDVELKSNPNFAYVKSIFNTTYTKQIQDTDNSTLLAYTSLNEEPSGEHVNILTTSKEKFFEPYFDKKEKRVDFFLSSKSQVSFENIKLDLDYTLSQPFSESSFKVNLSVSLIAVIALILLMRLVFKTWIAPLSSLAFVAILTMLSLSFYSFLSPNTLLTHSMLLISATLGLSNYLYFYYKWHVSQKYINATKALKYTLGRTFVPQLSGAIVLIFASTALYLITNVAVLYSLVSVILITVIISIILTPLFSVSVLSFFELKDPQLLGLEVFKRFSEKMGSNKESLGVLLLASFIIYGILSLTAHTQTQNSNDSKNVVTLAFMDKTLSLESIKKLETLETNLLALKDVESVISFNTYLKEQFQNSHPHEEFTLEKASIKGTLFYLDLFNKYDDIFKNEYLVVTIYLNENADINNLVNIIDSMSFIDDLLILDAQTLVYSAKNEAFSNVFASIIFLLILVALIVTLFTRDKKLIIKTIVLNAIPIIIFLGLVELLNITLSIELLIALMLSIAIASDAEIYQAYSKLADGSCNTDDVMCQHNSEFHNYSANAFIHSIMIFVLLGVSLATSGSIAITALYLGLILFLSTLSDFYLIPKILKDK